MEPGRDYSRSQISKAIGLAASEWNWAIRQLKDEGRVLQKGDRRAARYALAGPMAFAVMEVP